MKVGFCVEGSTDRALLEGLRQRWCPHVLLIEGTFRGDLKRREIPKACIELQYKGADLIIMIRDANTENWRDVLKGDREACRAEHQHLTIFAVCDRNVECWLTADAQYTATYTGHPVSDFREIDPKGAFDSAMHITALNRMEAELAHYTRFAPLRNWLANKSFEDFYEQLRQKSKEMGCQIENLLERT